MLVFNKCIYGEVLGGYTGDISIDWYSRDIQDVKTKTVQCNNKYQFNLGDHDLKGISSLIENGESVRIYIDGVWSDMLELDTDPITKYDIDISGYSINSDVASGDETLVRIVSDKRVIEDLSNSMYSYFKIENSANEIISDGNGYKIEFIPKVSDTYTITQRGYNDTTGNVTEKVTTLEIAADYVETESIDYIFYTKRGKVLQIELPEYVTDTLLLETGWYYENDRLLGVHNVLTPLEMEYSRGKVIIKTQIGDILDY